MSELAIEVDGITYWTTQHLFNVYSEKYEMMFRMMDRVRAVESELAAANAKIAQLQSILRERDTMGA